MNNGLYIGFTRKFSNIPPSFTFPQLEILFYGGSGRELTADDINKVITTESASAVAFTLPVMSIRPGECIHIKQRGAGQVTITPNTGVTIEVASTVKKTRAQYSVITLMKESDTRTSSQVWTLFGDFASS